MELKDFKRIARILKQAYQELEQEAIDSGIDILSKEYEGMVDKVRIMILAKAGYTIEEYRQAKEKYENERKEQREKKDSQLKDVFQNVAYLKGEAGAKATNEELIALIKPLIPKPIDGKTPTAEDLLKLIRPLVPIVKNGETPTDEKLLSLIRPLIPVIDTEKIIKPIEAEIGYLDNRIKDVERKIPQQVNIDKVKEDLRADFGAVFKKNIDILGMPDFRKLAMGLQQQIDDMGGGGATPGGSDTQVQFNDGGSALGGDAGFTWNKTTDTAVIGKTDGTVKFTIASGTVGALNAPSLSATSDDGSESMALRRGVIVQGTASNPNPYLDFSSADGVTSFNILYNVSTARLAVGEAVDFGATSLETIETQSVGITIDGGGSVITTGIKGYISVPYKCTIQSWVILADVSGSIVVDVWKDTYANYPPTVADTIAGSEKPTLSTAIKNTDTNLTTWTTAVAAGDILAFNVDSATTVTRVHVILKVLKS